MPRIAKPLSALAISKMRHSNRAPNQNELIAVGHVPGLCLQLGPPDADGNSSKSWIYRAVIGGKRRSAGLGSYPTITLAMAIEAARAAHRDVREGRDPIEARRTAVAALAATRARELSVAEIIERFIPIRLAKIKGERSKHRWQSSVESYVVPIIGPARISDVSKADVLRVLRQPHTNERTEAAGELWSVIPETARKLRGRLEEILDWAISNGHRQPPNPAVWSGNLEHDLPAKGEIAREVSHPAISVDEAPRWFAALQERGGTGALALQFLALTAVRSGNVRNMTWQHVDIERRLWIIPAHDMKEDDNGEHVVPLTSAMLALLDQAKSDSDLVFPSTTGKPLSDMALSMLMRKMHAAQLKHDNKGWIDSKSNKPAVPHGLRSTFSTWANDHAEYEADMIEFALAHRVGNEVAQRYRRGSMVEKRRQLMADWSDYLHSHQKKMLANSIK